MLNLHNYELSKELNQCPSKERTYTRNVDCMVFNPLPDDKF